MYSRRRALAEQLPENQAFQRNLANRLWAVFFGRGLIHPLDGVSPANPPSHPELLALLTERLVSGGFQLRPFVRGIVLSEVYQRAVESPSVTAVDLAEVESQVASITAARDKAVAQLQSLERAEAAAQARMRAAAEAERTVDAALQPLLAERDEARKASDAAVKAAADATAVAERAAAVAAAMTTAVAEAKRAAGLLDDDDASLKKIVTTLNAEAKSRSEVSQAALTASTNAEQARQAALEKLVKARTDVAEVAARQSPVTLAQLSREAADARAELVHRQQQLDRLGWRLALADDLTVAATSPSSATAETTVRWQSIEDRWTENLQVARLRPLTPDQFVYSMLQATGGLGRLWNKATVAVEQQPPDSVANAPEADRPTVRRDAVEQEFLNDVEALLGPFASNFGDPLLEGFQASVSQALLMANGPQVAGELVSQEEGLVRRLIAIGDPVMIVDEACLAILSRSPHPEERDELASHLTKNRDDLPQAIRELVWAMLASNEFRFNH